MTTGMGPRLVPIAPGRPRGTTPGARLLALALLVAAVACPVAADAGAHHAKHRRETGLATWYGPGFGHQRTASGERFDPGALTAAHRTLPFGTRVRVTNLENGRHVVVRINDRGPWRKDRVLDLSRAAARKLGFLDDGVARVRLEVLKEGRGAPGQLANGDSARD